jgi:hypothetical protein
VGVGDEHKQAFDTLGSLIGWYQANPLANLGVALTDAVAEVKATEREEAVQYVKSNTLAAYTCILRQTTQPSLLQLTFDVEFEQDLLSSLSSLSSWCNLGAADFALIELDLKLHQTFHETSW